MRPGSELGDLEDAVHPNGTVQIEVVGRRLHDGLVDFLELFGSAVAADPHLVIDRFVARRNTVAEAEEAAQVERALGRDLELGQRDAVDAAPAT